MKTISIAIVSLGTGLSLCGQDGEIFFRVKELPRTSYAVASADPLSPSLRAAVDGHVASCERCAAVLADVRSIVDRAAALPELKPSHDLWWGIEARLDAPVVPITAAAHSRPFPAAVRRAARRCSN